MFSGQQHCVCVCLYFSLNKFYIQQHVANFQRVLVLVCFNNVKKCWLKRDNIKCTFKNISTESFYTKCSFKHISIYFVYYVAITVFLQHLIVKSLLAT